MTNRDGEIVRLLFSTAVFQEPAWPAARRASATWACCGSCWKTFPDGPRETGLVAFDPRMTQIMALVHRVKDNDSTILITGESGTGKVCWPRKSTD